MIVLRRVLAVSLAAGLVLTFGAAVILSRAAEVALDPAFVEQELRRLDVYDYVHDAVLPAALDEALSDPEGLLPENLGNVDLPTDAASRRVMLRLAREVFPPEFLRAQAEHVLDEFWPYIAGQRDEFEIHFALDERLDAAFGHAPGEPSPVERAFRDLEMGRRLIDAAFQAFEEQVAAEGEASPAEVAAMLDEVVPDRDAVAEWFTAQLFAAIDGLLPYVTGASDSFSVAISFSGRAALADPLSAMLGRSPEELRDEGFVFSDRDLNEALAGADPEAGARMQEEIDRRLEVFREGFSYTQVDFLEDVAPDRADPAAAGFDAEKLRGYARLARSLSRWGGLAASAVLVALIGLLGGRRWPTRFAWASSALMAASGAWWALSGPLYRGVAVPQTRRALQEATAGWSESFAPLAPDFVSKVETVAGDFVGGIEARALLWLALSALALTGAAAWGYATRPRADGDDVAEMMGAPPSEAAAEPRTPDEEASTAGGPAA